MISVEECNHIVSEFRAKYRMIFQSPNVHGLVVGVDNDQPILQLLVVQKLPEKSLTTDQRMPGSFNYSYDGQTKQLKTRVRAVPIAEAYSHNVDEQFEKARAGESAWGQDLVGAGTAGWNILLNNVPVCVSNWHVFCGLGNATPIGRRVFISARNLAGLYTFQPIYSASVNQWDYALAQYDNLNSVGGQYRSCNDGSVKPYPRRLTTTPKFRDQYYKVGAREPICRTGTLETVGFRTIRYHDGTLASFERQLIFSKMSDPGDSGSIIVKSDDNTVTGLNFAGGDGETIANPFYQNPWTPIGSFTTNDGNEIPAFIGDPNLTRSSTFLHAEGTNLIGQRLLGDRIVPFDDLPGFSAGKLFLGTRSGVIDTVNGSATMHGSLPAPIRPNVSVEAVVGGITGRNNWNYPDRINVVFLCFG